MLKQQGSNRIYTRETDANGRSVIRVQGTNRDENRAFIYMARHFHALGLPVPELYSVSDDEMSYTQEDLGDTILFDHLDNYTLLERTIRALAHIQVTGAQDFDWSVCFPVPAMDERAIRWDLNYFKYCFLKGTKIEFSEPRLEDEFDRLVGHLLSTLNTQHSTFLYRDFQSRNVMIKDDQPYFIDFQGGRRGPTQYDVASFLWQAKANFSPELREQLIEAYLDDPSLCIAQNLAGSRCLRLPRVFRAQTPFPRVHPPCAEELARDTRTFKRRISLSICSQ